MDISEELSRFEVGSKERTFFEKLFEKLGPNFVRKSVEEEKREVHNNLNNAMENYFQSYILKDAIIKSTDQLEISQKASSSNISPLYLNFVQNFLSPESSDQPKLFGLSKKDIGNKNAELETATLKKLVEKNINDFCIKLIECTGGTVLSFEDWQSAFDRAMKDLENKATLVSSEEAKQRSKKQVNEMIKTYYEELFKGVLLLNKLLSLHSENLELEANLAKFYKLRCHAVSLKTHVFKMKMLEASYNEETIPALKKISAQLDQTEQKLKEEQNEKTVSLEQYLKLGEEYERFVDEYAQLIKCIKQQQWAIDELKSRNSQYGASGHG